MARFSLFFLVLLIFGLMSGCAEEAPQQLQAPVPRASLAKGKKQPVQPVDPEMVEEEKAKTYSYNPDGRDPFQPLMAIQKRRPDQPSVPLTPLQKFDLGQIRLIGVIVGLDEPKAMVVAPDGKSYILKKGTKIGKNEGSVVEINRREVLIEEVYYDFAGEARRSIQKIRLPEREGV